MPPYDFSRLDFAQHALLRLRRRLRHQRLAFDKPAHGKCFFSAGAF
jgi:hypothetical protein